MRLCICLAATVLLTGPLSADNWPQWRGPSATGVAEAGTHPVELTDLTNVVWKAALPAAAPSTPAVWGNRIFVTSPIDGKDGLLCFDRDGRERWRVRFGREAAGKHQTASGSNPSPLTDGRHVFVYYKSGTLAALDFDGNTVWKDNLQDRYGPNTLWWDLGTSPVLAAGNVVVAVMQTGDSYVVAFDAATGKVAWKVPRLFTCPRESDQSYTTPSVVSVHGRERLVVWGADHLTCHDASTGRMLWECDGFNPEARGMWRTISSASVWDHVAVLSYGRGRRLCAIDLRDDPAPAGRWLWQREDIGADVPTPVTRDGQAYVLEDGGKVVCLDITTGRDVWVSDAARGYGRYYASPIVAGDHLYCVSESGVVVALRLADKGASAATYSLGESVIATPVPVNRRLLIRGAQHLFCLGK